MKIKTVYDNSWRNPSFSAPFRRPVRWYEQDDSDEPREDGEGFTVEQLLGSLDGTKEQKTLRRTLQVQDKWRVAVEKVYGPASAFVLAHINAVYIMKKEDYLARKGKSPSRGTEDEVVSRETTAEKFHVKQEEASFEPNPSDFAGSDRTGSKEDAAKVVIVYVDDPTVRADVDAKQELLKLQLLKNRENVTEMKILASRFGMKERHPYRDYLSESKPRPGMGETVLGSSVDISSESLEAMDRILDEVQDPLVRRRLEKSINRNLRPYVKEK